MKNSANSVCAQTVTTVRHGEDAPEKRITLIGAARQLVRSNGDDGDNRCANRIEECLHPPQTTIRNVSQ